MTKIYRTRERKREIELQLTQANPAGAAAAAILLQSTIGALCRQKPQKDPNNLTEEEKEVS